MSTGLSVNDLVNVTISLQPTAVPVRNFGAGLVVGYSSVIDVTQRIRAYANITGVAADFGTTTPEYLAAVDFFAQSPQPSILYIGRWAKTPTAGLLHGGILSATAQAALITTLAAISSNGSMTISVDGTPHTLSTLNFTGVSNLPAAAAVINTVVSAYATCTWNASYGRFEIVSNTTGATSSVSYATPTGSGTDVSTPLALTAALATAPVVGIVAETPLTALTLLAGATNDWYAAWFAVASYGDVTTAQYTAMATYMEAANPPRILGISTNDANCLNAGSTTDIAYITSAAAYSRTFVQYSSTDVNVISSFFGRAATTDYSQQNAAITLMFKQEPGELAETLTESQASALRAKNCNVFVNYNNNTAILQFGTMANGLFFDTRQGMDWQANDLQTSLYNLLYTSTTKIPQTDAGVHMFVTTAEQSMQRGVFNGLSAPGVWTSTLQFGTLNTGDTLSKGYYVYGPPIASQSPSARATRACPPLQIAYKLAGAIQSVNAAINVNT